MSEFKGCPMGHGPSGKAADADDNHWHGAKMDFAHDMSYGDYLGLEQILSAQHPHSPNHNEMLFIVQHQTTELWMKLMLHELRAARDGMRNDELRPVFKMLMRVSRIMDQLAQAWNVLSTMTPPEYSAMRPHLGASSGFQSYQYREIEFILGNKNVTLLRPHAHRPEHLARLEVTLHTPSMYDEALRLMDRRGFQIDAEVVDRDWAQPTAYNASVEAAWLEVYCNPSKYWELYELGEKFIDLEDALRQWRFRHMTTVERVIGFKRGTGGTEGVNYLRKMLDVVLFPELWKLRTNI